MGAARKVLVISKNSLFREGLLRVLADLREFELLDSVATLKEAIQLAAEAPPDVIVFDGEDEQRGSEELAQLLQLSPDQVVTLSLADSKMTVFTRRHVARATVEDLLGSIQRDEE